MSLQKKIILSFLISSALIAIFAIFAYVNFIEIRKEILNLELSDTLRSKTLQLRRHEKNFLLYRDVREIESVHAYIKEIKAILEKNKPRDTNGQILNLQASIEDYSRRFSRIETLAWEFLDNIEKLKKRNTQYALFFPLMEATFLESPAVNARQIEILFKPGADSAILNNLRDLDTEITALRKIGEEILTLSKGLDTVTREKVDRTIRISQTALLILFPLFLIVGFSALLVIVRSTVRQMKMLTSAIEKTGKGDFSSLPAPDKHDEVGVLIDAFNKMENDLIARDHEIEKKNEELLQSRKLASLGTLASGVAHELNNPLNNIYLAAQILTKEIDTETCPGIIKETVGDIYSQTLRVKRIVSDLLAFAREKPPELAPVQITVLIKGILTQMAATDDLGDVRYAIQAQEDATVLADSHMMEQVFINLFNNAVDAMEGKGLLTITIDRDGPIIKISVSDTGKGIPKEKLQRIFDPFFTTKDHGTGLGLAIVYSILEKHKGRIDLQHTSEKGSTFLITLPGGV
ncbi:MAG: HAMP domain-containing protein [Nitrospirae bacterium]|nr:HAMP domain-containing protein [Nitrospirota bacterium]